MVDSEVTISWELNSNFAAGLGKFFVNGNFTDCVLLAEGKAIAAHRLVLSIHSLFFEEFFERTSVVFGN